MTSYFRKAVGDLWLLLAVTWAGLQCEIMAFPVHTHRQVHSGKSVTIRESNHASGVRQAKTRINLCIAQSDKRLLGVYHH